MAGTENNPLAKNWLVKSSTKILGPFTREEVLELLTHRQITIIDEIRQPEGRWNYIRENRHFKEIVKNLRYEDDHSREDTMTSTMTSTATQNNQTVTQEFVLGPMVPPAPPSATGASAQKPTIKDVTPTSGSVSGKSSGSAKSFGNLQDQRVQNKIQKQNIFLRAILLGIVACAALFLTYNYVRKDRHSDMGYSQLLSSALRYKELGLYDRALENYKKASALKEPDLASQFQMAFLLINQDRQSLNGRRIIERASMQEGRSRREIIDGHLGIALSYMMEGDFGQAEDHFQKALGFDPNNFSAKFNQATIAFKKGNYEEAMKAYEGIAHPENPMYPLVLLYRSMALVEIAKAAGSGNPALNESSKKLSEELKTSMLKSHFLRKELALMLACLKNFAHDFAAAQEATSTLLEEPLGFTAQFVKDPSLDWRNAEWDYLEKYCAELYQAGDSLPDMKAVRAVCLLESNRDMEATKFIDEAMAAAPAKASSLEAQAVYLWKLGRLNDAKLLLQNSEFKNTRLALYVQGEACSKAKDAACAEAAYRTLEKNDSTDVVPPYGLARLRAEQKDKPQALNFIKTGLEREKNFIPLIELREKLESM
jgi:tetratricopeptide (TPR) repeat protein